MKISLSLKCEREPASDWKAPLISVLLPWLMRLVMPKPEDEEGPGLTAIGQACDEAYERGYRMGYEVGGGGRAVADDHHRAPPCEHDMQPDRINGMRCMRCTKCLATVPYATPHGG